MQEGWHADDYLILYDESEWSAVTDRYDIAQSLPGFEIVGLRSWDDFIVRDPSGTLFTVPTVPINREFFKRFKVPIAAILLELDPRFNGKLKWYIQPLVFGGDPLKDENMTWIGHDDHIQAVRWWNEKYRELKRPVTGRRSTLLHLLPTWISGLLQRTRSG